MRLKKTLLILIVRLLSSILPSVLGLFLNYQILSRFGSDVNGLISTIAQFVNFFHLFEGGVSLASTIALYRPYQDNDYDQVNNTAYTLRVFYRRISVYIIISTVVLALISPFIIQTRIDYITVAGLIIIMSFGVLSNYYLFAKYDVIFSVAQKEYKNETLTLVFNIISQLFSIIMIYLVGNILVVKLVGILILIIRTPLLIKIFKSNFPNVSFKFGVFDRNILKKSKDVWLQKTASLIFGSTDMILLSLFVGTSTTSIYAVYNFIFAFLKSILSSIILAPFNGFGQKYSEGDLLSLKNTYYLFKFIGIFSVTIILSSAVIVVLPFVALYTMNTHDVNYIDIRISILFSIVMYFELMIDILGLLGNSSGNFKQMRYIAQIGAIINLVISLLLVSKYSVSGVLIGTLCAYCVMYILQLNLISNTILKSKISDTMVIVLPNIFIFSISIVFSTFKTVKFSNYLDFLGVGFVVFIFVFIVTCLINIVLNRRMVFETINLFQSLKKKVEN